MEAATPTSQSNGQSPLDAQRSAYEDDAGRPELAVGAALLGGIVLAQVLKKLGGDD